MLKITNTLKLPAIIKLTWFIAKENPRATSKNRNLLYEYDPGQILSKFLYKYEKWDYKKYENVLTSGGIVKILTTMQRIFSVLDNRVLIQ